MIEKTGGAAFPNDSAPMNGNNMGMTLRDYMAAKALTGLLSCADTAPSNPNWARRAYEIADAMLAERAK